QVVARRNGPVADAPAIPPGLQILDDFADRPEEEMRRGPDILHREVLALGKALGHTVPVVRDDHLEYQGMQLDLVEPLLGGRPDPVDALTARVRVGAVVGDLVGPGGGGAPLKVAVDARRIGKLAGELQDAPGATADDQRDTRLGRPRQGLGSLYIEVFAR